MKLKAIAIPYIIALILGVIIIGTLGYLFVNQGGKTISVGLSAECDAMKFSFCQGFRNWDTSCDPQPNLLECGQLLSVEGGSETENAIPKQVSTFKGGLL